MYPKATEGQEGYCDIASDQIRARKITSSKSLKEATRTSPALNWGWCSRNCWARQYANTPLAYMLQIAHIHVIKPEDCVSKKKFFKYRVINMDWSFKYYLSYMILG